jgi:uncharacterized surface protein with fasciclin (FAS1) repeats
MRTLLGMVAALALVVPAFAGEKKDIVDTAVGAGLFKTLVAAVKAADLVDTLKGEGPFTVLAPTDEAFAKLPEGTVESLLKPENKDKLIGILKYHVIPGKVLAADVVKLDGQDVKTVEGSTAKVTVKDGGVTINNAKVVKTSRNVEHARGEPPGSAALAARRAGYPWREQMDRKLSRNV